MQSTGEPKRARVLDPVDRVTEVIFGLLMAMTFTGTISVATSGRESERTMMITALGCNLAWGFADAVMYLLRTLIERVRNRTLRASLCGATDAVTGKALIAEALPPRLAAVVGTDDLESLRRRVLEFSSMPLPPASAGDDFKGAWVFLLVALSTLRLWCRFWCWIGRRSPYAFLTWSDSQCCSSPVGYSRNTLAQNRGKAQLRWQ